jgi:hypothetical protein
MEERPRLAPGDFRPQRLGKAGHHIAFTLILTFMILALRGIIPASEV